MASDIHTGSIDVLSNEEEHKTLIESKPKRRFIINPFRGFYNAGKLWAEECILNT